MRTLAFSLLLAGCAVESGAAPTLANLVEQPQAEAQIVGRLHVGQLVEGRVAVEFAGEDRGCRPALERITGDRFLVTFDAIDKPVAVRSAWSASPVATLINAADLRAAPFRSDVS